MFITIYNLIKSLFLPSEKKVVINKKVWIKNELEKWKLDMYSSNSNLSYIPNAQIIKKEEQLKKEFDKKFNF